MTVSDDDDDTSVIVPGNSTVNLIDVPTLFETADIQPGTIMTVIISAVSDEEAVEHPVLREPDQYKDVVPNNDED